MAAIAAAGGHSCVVLRPTGRGPGSVYQNYGEVDVLEAIEHVAAHYAIDRARISITGSSMGGAAVWYLTSHYPDLFAAAAPFCGYCDYRRPDLPHAPLGGTLLAIALGRLPSGEPAAHLPVDRPRGMGPGRGRWCARGALASDGRPAGGKRHCPHLHRSAPHRPRLPHAGYLAASDPLAAGPAQTGFPLPCISGHLGPAPQSLVLGGNRPTRPLRSVRRGGCPQGRGTPDRADRGRPHSVPRPYRRWYRPRSNHRRPGPRPLRPRPPPILSSPPKRHLGTGHFRPQSRETAPVLWSHRRSVLRRPAAGTRDIRLGGGKFLQRLGRWPCYWVLQPSQRRRSPRRHHGREYRGAARRQRCGSEGRRPRRQQPVALRHPIHQRRAEAVRRSASAGLRRRRHPLGRQPLSRRAHCCLRRFPPPPQPTALHRRPRRHCARRHLLGQSPRHAIAAGLPSVFRERGAGLGLLGQRLAITGLIQDEFYAKHRMGER
ncbi:MAG: prolyl oligopeptidase family serine peptidase [Candidatus Latescibacteria bacterium]|nr:prolyl oligopeptidase family serine peptidase [Candidatus Latescibacterota bacterium]